MLFYKSPPPPPEYGSVCHFTAATIEMRQWTIRLGAEENTE